MDIDTGYLAYVQDGDTFDPATHARSDEIVLSFSISQKESEFATADVEIVRPASGILSRQDRRVFLSVDVAGVPTLVFDGYVSGHPVSLFEESITLELVAEPANAESQVASLIAGLKTAPGYDELYLAPDRRDDPAEVLSGYAKALFWDRRTGVATLTNLTSGSKSLTITPEDGSLAFDISETPVRRVDVSVEAQWEQRWDRDIEVGDLIANAFGGKISTYTPDAIRDGWPRAGANLGSGWRVERSKLSENSDPGPAWLYPRDSGPVVQLDDTSGDLDPAMAQCTAGRRVRIKRYYFDGGLELEAQYRQKRVETAVVSVGADLQEINRQGGRVENETIRLQSVTEIDTGNIPDAWASGLNYKAGDRVLYGGRIYECNTPHTSADDFYTHNVYGSNYWNYVSDGSYIGDLSRASFFQTDRGRAALKHAIERAVARLTYASRAAEITFACRLDEALDVDTDTIVTVIDDRIPGGAATGKVTDYTLTLDGDGGSGAEITIACCVGQGGAGGVTLGDYSDQEPATPVTPGDISNEYVDLQVEGTAEQQYEAMIGSDDPVSEVKNAPTRIRIRCRSLRTEGSIDHTISAPVSGALALPQQIDLSA